MNTFSKETLLKSKQHFHVLDGLRGIAALAVVIFHFMEWIYPDFTENFIGHGSLPSIFLLSFWICNCVRL